MLRRYMNMGARFWMILLFTSFITANSSSIFQSVGLNKGTFFDLQLYAKTRSFYNCDGTIGDCIDEAEEMMLDSEASKQILALEQRFSSYMFFDKEHVPCNQPGQSYYTCQTKL
ncbi:putative Rapid ALkalinization Factor [Heracleum sosnowskyi]|uniref:Rapid ALkalinization Factor n=1 Tax=Heracleum sosnowskyi TaxID=360622 RepID=A0AAD8HZQ4_9APIA|nr:putative Rapid ALkalinization Factor [Heracleum sosnowskyi]